MIRRFILSIGLLSLIAPILYGQLLSEKELKYLEKKAVNIEVDTSYRQGDWSSIMKAIGNKRIVMLGEPNHGAGEVFVSRNDLIKDLHEKLGFNVVLFESGTGGIAGIDHYRHEFNAREMTRSFFGIWTNEPFRDLMSYIQTNKLSVAGFDVQPSGRIFDRLLREQAQKMKLGLTTYDQLEKRFSAIDRKLSSNSTTAFDSIQGPTNRLITDYKFLIMQIDEAQVNTTDKQVLFTKRTLLNRTKYLRLRLTFLRDKNWRQRFEDRDRAMAANVDWLLENVYKEEKVIVIGHNFHLAKANEKEVVMGELLMDKYASETYVLGIYTGGGTYLGNSGDRKSTDPKDPDNLDIKHIIQELKGRAHFLNFPKRNRKGSDWMFNEVVINDSFINLNGSNHLVLTNYFDGVLLLDKVSPPVK